MVVYNIHRIYTLDAWNKDNVLKNYTSNLVKKKKFSHFQIKPFLVENAGWTVFTSLKSIFLKL